MKPKPLLIALVVGIFLSLMPVYSMAQPTGLDYKVTLSGKSYATVSYGLGEQPAWRDTTFNYGFIGGVEQGSGTPIGGLGGWLTWRDPKTPLFATAGLYVIAPQKDRPDLSIGFSIGLRL